MNPEGRACSEPRLHHCTPAWATERDSVSKKKQKTKNKKTKKTQNKQTKASRTKEGRAETSKQKPSAPLAQPGATAASHSMVNEVMVSLGKEAVSADNEAN